MGSNLVGATGEGFGFQQAVALQMAQNSELCNGGFPIQGVNDGTVPAIAILAERCRYSHFLPVWLLGYQSMVQLGSPMFLKLRVQGTMGIGTARQHDDPTGLSIQSMHNPQASKTQLQDRSQVGQRPVIPIGQGEHPGGFIHSQQVIIRPKDELLWILKHVIEILAQLRRIVRFQ